MNIHSISINYNADYESDSKGYIYSQSILRRGLGRNKDFIRRLYERRKLKDNEGVIINSENSFNRIIDLIDSLEELYPDNWDMFVKGTRSGFVSLYPFILFKEINITNSENHEHLINDLIVVIPLRNSQEGLHIPNLFGTRATLSYEEYSSYYFHSHLMTKELSSPGYCFSIDQFCLGATEIQDLISQIRYDYSKELLQLFLLTIRSLVEWESVEGGPYVYIKDCINAKNNLRESIYNDYKYENFISNFWTNIDYKSLRYSLQDNHIVLTNCDNLEEQYKKFLIGRFSRGYIIGYSHIGHRKDKDKWLFVNESSIGRSNKKPRWYIDGKIPYMYFRGEKIHFSIADPVEKEINYDTLDIHPLILKNAKNEIERRIKEKQAKGRDLERVYKFKNSQISNQQDSIPV